jgi:acyl carrier protein
MDTASTLSATVFDTVAAIAKNHTGPVHGSDRLREDLHLDSMAQLELAVALEERLHTPVPDATVMRARTVDDLVGTLSG